MSTKLPRLASVVTGASSGIGAALSTRLLNEGWKVAMISRNMQKMEDLLSDHAHKQNAKPIQCDLCKPTSTIDACQQIKDWLDTEENMDTELNLLVNNVGGMKKHTNLDTVDLYSWQWSLI